MVAYDVADSQIVPSKVGSAKYLQAVQATPVELNPRYGQLNPTDKTIVDGSTGSLSTAPPRRRRMSRAGGRPAAGGLAPGRGDGHAAEACPWDAQQTHRSLVQYLVEETAETVEAIESGDVIICARSSATCCCRWCSTPRSRPSPKAVSISTTSRPEWRTS